MARFAAKEKGKYYPTPPNVVTWLITVFQALSGGRIFDPCAGKGFAVSRLAKGLNMWPYANELNSYRASEAKRKINEVIHSDDFQPVFKDETFRHSLKGNFHWLKVTHRAFNLLFLNPPYDVDKEEGREEYDFLKKSNAYLQYGGHLVFIIQQQTLRYKYMSQYLAEWFEDVKVFRFPDGEYEKFGQIVFIGKKRKERTVHKVVTDQLIALGNLEIECPPIDKVKIKPIHIEPLTNTNVIRFQQYRPSVDEMLEDVQHFGAHLSEDATYFLNPPRNTTEMLNPLMPFKTSHMAQVIAAGALNNMVMGEGQEALLLKGTATKSESISTKTSQYNEDRKEVKTTKREFVSSQIVTLSKNGYVNLLKDKRLADFFEENMDSLADMIAKAHPPLYNLELGKYDELIGEEGTPFLLQKHAAAALATLYATGEKGGFADGEQSVGKSRLAGFVIKAAQFKSALVTCEVHLWRKWIRELSIVIPDAHIKLLTTPKEIDAFVKYKREHPDQVCIGIMTYVDIRQGSGWKPITGNSKLISPKEEELILKKMKGKIYNLPKKTARKEKFYFKWKYAQEWVRSPSTNKRLYDNKGELLRAESVLDGKSHCNYIVEPEYASVITNVGYAPDFYMPKSYRRRLYYAKGLTTESIKSKQRFDPLWQETRYGGIGSDSFLSHCKRMRDWERRLEDDIRAQPFPIVMKRKASTRLAHYILKRYKRQFDFLVADEVHKLRGPHSGQGVAFAKLASSCKHVLGLTGSLSNGKASGIFPLLYRINKDVRAMFTNEARTGRYRINMRDWIREYGILETVETFREDATGKLTAAKSKPSPREGSGYTPQILKWTLPITVYLDMDSLGVDMPAYTEEVVEVEMTPEMERRHFVINMTLGDEAKKRMARKDRSLLGAYMQVNLCAPDTPYREEIIIEPKTRKDPKPEIVFKIPGVASGENTLYPKEIAILDRMVKVKEGGRRTLLLCTQTGRRDITRRWAKIIRQKGLTVAVLRGVEASDREAWLHNNAETDVIIAHPKAVATGLDIISHSVIMVMGIEQDPTVLQQATRRAWRIGQTQDCLVIYFIYKGTFQEDALYLIMQKMAAMYRLRGVVIEENHIANVVANSLTDLLANILTNGAEQQGEKYEKMIKEINALYEKIQAVGCNLNLVDDPDGFFSGCRDEHDIKKRWRSLVKRYHPDAQHAKKNQADVKQGYKSLQDMFNQINEDHANRQENSFVGYQMKHEETPMTKTPTIKTEKPKQWRSDDPKHCLIPDDSNVPTLYFNEGTPLGEQIVHLRWHSPSTDFEWYILEYDPDKKIAYAYCYGVKGKVSTFNPIPLEEVTTIGIVDKADTMPIERDLDFVPCTFNKLVEAQLNGHRPGPDKPVKEASAPQAELVEEDEAVVDNPPYETIVLPPKKFKRFSIPQHGKIMNCESITVIPFDDRYFVNTMDQYELAPHPNPDIFDPDVIGIMGMECVPQNSFEGEWDVGPNENFINLAIECGKATYVMTKPVFVIEGVTEVADKGMEKIEVPAATFLGVRVADDWQSIVDGERVGRPFAIDNRLFLSVANDEVTHLSSGQAIKGVELHHPLLWQGETMRKAIVGADSWAGVRVTNVLNKSYILGDFVWLLDPMNTSEEVDSSAHAEPEPEIDETVIDVPELEIVEPKRGLPSMDDISHGHVKQGGLWGWIDEQKDTYENGHVENGHVENGHVQDNPVEDTAPAGKSMSNAEKVRELQKLRFGDDYYDDEDGSQVNGTVSAGSDDPVVEEVKPKVEPKKEVKNKPKVLISF